MAIQDVPGKKADRRWILAFAAVLSLMALSFLPALWHIGMAWPADAPGLLDEASRGLTEYEIGVSVDTGQYEATALQKVRFSNPTPYPLYEAYFHLYPNAYSSELTAPFARDNAYDWSMAYPQGFSPGYIEIYSARINGRNTGFEYLEEGDQILKVRLPEPLLWGQAVELELSYQLKLPLSSGRFGYGKIGLNMANWYPILCAYDEQGWNMDPYYAVGDPFYSDMANYSVTISAPKGYKLASTGEIVTSVDDDWRTIWEISAPAVRDFAFFLSDKLQVAAKNAGNTTVYAYSLTQQGGERVLDYAAGALEVLSEEIGEYPYGQLSVVESDFFIGGMEYPNVVQISSLLYGPDYDPQLHFVIAHEVAHQWFYQMIGNDEVDEPWLDEAMTQYATLIYFEKRYGKEMMLKQYQDYAVRSFLRYFLMGYENVLDQRIDLPVYEYPDNMVYDALVYGKGAMMMHGIRESIGDGAFFQAIKDYYMDNRFKNATAEDLYVSFSQAAGADLRPLFAQWLRGAVPCP